MTRCRRFAPLLMLLAGPALAATAPLRLCMPGVPIPPYISADPARPGLLDRLLVDSAKAVGIALEIKSLPPGRCRMGMEDGSVDVTLLVAIPSNLVIARMPMRVSATTPPVLDAERRALRVQHVVVRRTGENQWQWDGQKFQPVRPAIGIRRGIQIYQEILDRHQIQADDAAIDGDQLLRKLLAGRVDLVLLTRAEFEARQEAKPRPLEALPAPFFEADYFLGLRRQHTDEQGAQVEAWWAAIAKMRELPEYRWRGQAPAR